MHWANVWKLIGIYDMLLIKKKYRLDYDSVMKTENNEQ